MTETVIDSRILTINGGSSTIKFAVYGQEQKLRLRGSIDRIGSPQASLSARAGGQKTESPVEAADHAAAAGRLIDWLNERGELSALAGVGHRIVHGGTTLLDHQPITPGVLAALRQAQPLDLAHLPREIALIDAFSARLPNVPQVACFDTAFFRDLPIVAQRLPIPRRFAEAGIRRFGFHGLSYTYLLSELQTIAPKEAAGRVIFAHLGSGASMAAVQNGRPIDTTMAFTPLAGLVMATRPGDLDPGLVCHIMKTENLSPDQMADWLSRQCGLIGVSQTSGDMRDLLGLRSDPKAAEAVELFCYQAKKFIGAYAAAMGGLDAIVFSGGIGEHAAPVREKICAGLTFLGVHLDASRNKAAAAVISTDASAVTVRVIPTDEEVVIAQTTRRVLK